MKMNYPALKGEVSAKEKMLSQTSPRLRRNDVMFHGFTSCIPNAPEKLSRTPEVSAPEMISQPGMFTEQLESTVAFKQLQSPANAHRRRQLDKEMDVISSNVQLVNLAAIPPSSCVQNSFAVNPNPVKLHRVSGIFRFPHEVEGILSERMLSGSQIHFFPPANSTGNPAHAKFANLISRGATAPLVPNHFKELNFEDGNSSPGFQSQGILAVM